MNDLGIRVLLVVLTITGAVLMAVADALYDGVYLRSEGDVRVYKKWAKVVDAASILFIVVISAVFIQFKFEETGFWPLIKEIGLLLFALACIRLTLFDITYNLCRRLDWRFGGSTTFIYHRVMNEVKQHPSLYVMLLIISLIVGVSVLTMKDGLNLFDVIANKLGIYVLRISSR